MPRIGAVPGQWVLALVVLCLFPLSAGAQGLGGIGGLNGVGGLVGGLPPVLSQPLEGVTRPVGDTANRVIGAVDNVGRPQRPELFESDLAGSRVVRSEVLALSPTAATASVARALNFETVREINLAALGLRVRVLRAPQGMSATDALNALRMADPQGVYDYNHIYDPSAGLVSGVRSLFRGPSSADAHGTTIGLVDGGIDLSHPALRRARVVARNFAGRERSPASAHGTAIASLLLGESDTLKGVLPGATLYAADVYGGKAEGGSADAVAQGLAWVAEKGAAVINISLVGPPNRTLEAVVKALLARGYVIVAAVGNDGPARPVGYPAAYQGVIAVTSVDINQQIQIDANRGKEISFAALGVDVRVAGLNRTDAVATGTSFAAPLVVARFARLLSRPDVAASLSAEHALQAKAIDLGAPGRDDVFGYGYLERVPNFVLNASASAR